MIQFFIGLLLYPVLDRLFDYLLSLPVKPLRPKDYRRICACQSGDA